MVRVKNCLAFLGMTALLFSAPQSTADFQEPIGSGADALPLFDAHIHYKKPAWKPYPPEAVLNLMDRTGVAMGLVSSTPDQGTIMLWEHAPKRVVPEVRPYHDNVGSSNWTKAEGIGDYIENRLDRYPHEGIGEFHLHDTDPTDRPLLSQIARMAKERDLYIHVHSDHLPVEQLFDIEPASKIIWAHAGMTEPPEVIAKMMARYPFLTADTSYRESDILLSHDRLHPDWEALFHRFPERFMVGTDTWVTMQWDDYETLIAMNRRWLSLLPRSIAEKIAYKNAERLFGRKVSKDLLGQR
ncbi:amidohydrolase family protein [Magnetospira sp. QH-2]|uniref:amidohydrolase family protein n=1 Tax=Magnetospira sp. (strain QH-2) TaxID=1288970 RepID=UPI0003E80A55|nr:amidohydrolase family protein [Magnetospira sp. QH-2]CCQ74730.1 putative amidohydrolase [Magnetospira sp. QH-2]